MCYFLSLDHPILIQPFSNQAQSSSGNCKAEMVCMVAREYVIQSDSYVFSFACTYNQSNSGRIMVCMFVQPIIWPVYPYSQSQMGIYDVNTRKSIVNALFLLAG